MSECDNNKKKKKTLNSPTRCVVRPQNKANKKEQQQSTSIKSKTCPLSVCVATSWLFEFDLVLFYTTFKVVMGGKEDREHWLGYSAMRQRRYYSFVPGPKSVLRNFGHLYPRANTQCLGDLITPISTFLFLFSSHFERRYKSIAFGAENEEDVFIVVVVFVVDFWYVLQAATTTNNFALCEPIGFVCFLFVKRI